MKQLSGNILITGGAGTLGKAILRVAKEENWDAKFTIYSRDPMKHKELKKLYPEVVTVVGDMGDIVSLANAIAGHETVIHAAAMKHVVETEYYPMMAMNTNIDGSINLLEACLRMNVKKVIGISTDKAVSPTNTYGMTKMAMERTFQYYAQAHPEIEIHLVRYGNVFGSTGSFIHSWWEDMKNMRPVRSTDPNMTRFWLTEDDAVKFIQIAAECPSGTIFVPNVKACSIGQIEEWLIPDEFEIERIPVRPGEKTHESLISPEEFDYAEGIGDGSGFIIRPRNTPKVTETKGKVTYTSNGQKITKAEFFEMAGYDPDAGDNS